MNRSKANGLTTRIPTVLGFLAMTVVTTATVAAELPVKKGATALVSITATVEAIDQTTREVTLKGPLGNSLTLKAGPEVKRLEEVKVGDSVTADYLIAVAAELRELTAEEKKNPLVILEAAGRETEAAPAAAGVRRIKAVATIEGIDRSVKTVTVKGPLGRHITALVEDPAALEKMQLGQTIVITYTEAMAVSLEKTAHHKKN